MGFLQKARNILGVNGKSKGSVHPSRWNAEQLQKWLAAQSDIKRSVRTSLKHVESQMLMRKHVEDLVELLGSRRAGVACFNLLHSHDSYFDLQQQQEELAFDALAAAKPPTLRPCASYPNLMSHSAFDLSNTRHPRSTATLSRRSNSQVPSPSAHFDPNVSNQNAPARGRPNREAAMYPSVVPTTPQSLLGPTNPSSTTTGTLASIRSPATLNPSKAQRLNTVAKSGSGKSSDMVFGSFGRTASALVQRFGYLDGVFSLSSVKKQLGLPKQQLYSLLDVFEELGVVRPFGVGGNYKWRGCEHLPALFAGPRFVAGGSLQPDMALGRVCAALIPHLFEHQTEVLSITQYTDILWDAQLMPVAMPTYIRDDLKAAIGSKVHDTLAVLAALEIVEGQIQPNREVFISYTAPPPPFLPEPTAKLRKHRSHADLHLHRSTSQNVAVRQRVASRLRSSTCNLSNHQPSSLPVSSESATHSVPLNSGSDDASDQQVNLTPSLSVQTSLPASASKPHSPLRTVSNPFAASTPVPFEGNATPANPFAFVTPLVTPSAGRRKELPEIDPPNCARTQNSKCAALNQPLAATKKASNPAAAATPILTPGAGRRKQLAQLIGQPAESHGVVAQPSQPTRTRTRSTSTIHRKNLQLLEAQAPVDRRQRVQRLEELCGAVGCHELDPEVLSADHKMSPKPWKTCAPSIDSISGQSSKSSHLSKSRKSGTENVNPDLLKTSSNTAQRKSGRRSASDRQTQISADTLGETFNSVSLNFWAGSSSGSMKSVSLPKQRVSVLHST